MAARSGQELDMSRLVVIIAFLIVGGIYARTFFRNYVSDPASAAEGMARYLEEHRQRGIPPNRPMLLITPADQEAYQRTVQYVTTGDKQAKKWLIQYRKGQWRAKHSTEIWSSLIVVCVSIIVVVIAGIPILLDRWG